jgi:hypothetical protein
VHASPVRIPQSFPVESFQCSLPAFHTVEENRSELAAVPSDR